MSNAVNFRIKLYVVAAVAALGSLTLGGIGLWSASNPSAAWARWLIGSVMVFMFVGTIAAAIELVRSVVRPIELVQRELERVRKAFQAGDLETRADDSGLPSEFKPITGAMNAMLEATEDKVAWQVAVIDAVPFPIHVTDADMKWTFMNKAFEALMVREGRVKDRKHAVGMDCSNASANICKTEGCGIRQLQKGVKESFFDWCGMGCKQDTAAMLDKKGRKIGYVEVVSDLTPLIRVRDYTHGEVDRLAANLSRLAAGDMNLDLQVAAGDQHTAEARANFGKLRDSLATTAKALNDLLTKVAEAATQVSSASGQIASSSQAVASGATEQAQSLEETASRLESMAGLTKQSAGNAQQASALAQTARSATEGGSAAVERMVSAMGKIRASAEATSQIIKDINEITFQTNLLALNAAVEAARAGEAGRGFAVVAEEVRSLALRSKEAAQKTEELIRQSVKETESGAVTSRQVNDQLAEIALGISKVTDIVAEIASTAKEQEAGIAHVSDSMAQMNKVTQQNAANSEQSSSAAQELASQSEELASMVSSFRVNQQGGAVSGGVSSPRRNGASAGLPVVSDSPTAGSFPRARA